jgi:hypothetical protein
MSSIEVDPKAVSNDELFGYMHRQTREWKDGLFSTIMRDLANMLTDGDTIDICLEQVSLLFVRLFLCQLRNGSFSMVTSILCGSNH